MTLPIEMSFQDSTLGEFRKDRITKEGSTLVTFRGTLRGYARMGLKELGEWNDDEKHSKTFLCPPFAFKTARSLSPAIDASKVGRLKLGTKL
ncbi:hypothetical protein V1477_015961 [Vespula maculifrons]|uniref:Uncharacterized protein n=3 Tax=Vespula TaxID=7451 RepID=A0A834K7M4_VESGE|nr:hypothetical protein HZH66_006543 [Vespula vulgaris]KAF7401380.1 hypothetical protein HZH68_007200 [Vespula germanica]